MGVELEVFHAGSPQAAGRLQVTTVFRERSRARILGGAALRAKEQVRVPAPVYLAAVLQQVEALAGSGEGAKARDMARSALAWADANGAGDGDKRALLERLATLDYQAGDSASAEEHYRRVMAAFDSTPAASAPERDLVLNNLGSLYLLRGDLEQAEARFRDAPTDDAQTLNNLGVVAELRGDREKANTLYSDALRAVQYAPGADARDRQAIEANLARVRKPADAKQ
jgi:Flp pilus assembly protein TadD